jgi:hypothetical protein
MKSNEKTPVNNSSNTAKSQAPNRKRFQIVKLEPRIAPKLSANHNETIVRDKN